MIDIKSEDFVVLRNDVKHIRKMLEGNGHVGLCDEVKENTEHRVGSEANRKLIQFLVGGGWLTTLAILVFNIIK